MTTVTNPEYPLFFERFGNDSPGSNPRLSAEVTPMQRIRLAGQRNVDLIINLPQGINGAKWEDEYVEAKMYQAMSVASQGMYASDIETALNYAHRGLQCHSCCPSAHEVLARFSTTYEGAITHYEIAEKMSESCSASFSAQNEGNDVWNHQPMRDYYRCLQGHMH